MDDPRGGARTRTSTMAALFSVMSLVASAPAASAGIVSHTDSGDPTASTASTAPTAPVTSVFDDAYAWDPQFYGPGLDGTVTSAVVWDDGDGADLYVGGSFITAGSQRVDRIARWDGTSWSALPGDSGVGVNGAVSALTVYDGDLVVGGSFTRAGGETVNRIARWDGAQWSPLDGPAGTGVAGGRGPFVAALTVFDGDLVVGGSFTHAGGAPVDHVARWDGSGWAPLQGETRPGVEHERVPSAASVDAFAVYEGDLMVGGRFTNAGDVPADGLARWDGLHWSPLSGAEFAGSGLPGVSALTVFDGELIVGGFFAGVGAVQANNLARWDGSAWSAVGGPDGEGTDRAVRAIAVFDGALYAAGVFDVAGGIASTAVASWDGSEWSPLPGAPGDGLGGAASAHGATLVAYDGGLLVGGNFVTAGGTTARNLARWDGTMFSALPGPATGIQDGPVRVLAEHDGALIAGGLFEHAGAVATGHIARWDGSAWSALGAGIDGYSVDALVSFDGALVAAGNFDSAGGVAARSIARWDGTTWSELGGGVDGSIRAMTVHDGELIVGGDFSEAGGVTARNVARWDGNAWSALGEGTDDDVRTLAVHDAEVIAGGDFTEAGGTVVHHVARWDGAVWAGLPGASGVGTGGQVSALATYDGELVVGGNFREAGGLPANRIARWSGEEWASLGHGANHVVSTLAVLDDSLFAAGGFTQAGGAIANRVARWDGSAWSALSGPSGSGIDRNVDDVLAYDPDGAGPLRSGLVAGGAFTLAGGAAAWGVAAYRPLDLVVSPDQLDFGEVTVGTGSQAQDVRLTNAGTEPVSVETVTAPRTPFTATGGTCAEAPFTLAPGDACTITYTFRPDAAQPAAATAVITSDADTGRRTVTMRGAGAAPQPNIAVEPAAVDVGLGPDETAEPVVTVSNMGPGVLDWNVTQGSGPGPVLRPQGEATVPPGQDETPPGDGSGFVRAPEATPTSDAQTEPFEVSADGVTLSHSASMEVVSGTSVACGGGLGSTSEGHFLRTFTLADFGIEEDFDVSEVTFGIESLTAAAPITVNLYTLDGEFVFDNLTQIGTETTTLPFQTLSTVTVPVTGTAPAGSTLVVELEAPDMEGAFYPGANTAGQTAPSYVAAPGCGEPEPIPFAEIAGESVHLVLTMTGGERPECTLPEWLDVAPARGTTASGASSELGVSIDTAGLAPGPYAAHLCIESNDPDTVLSAVPVTLTVTEGPDLTLSAQADRVRPFYYRSQLSWTGGSAEQIDVYRDGELVTTTADDGAFTDEIGRIREAVVMQYRVCEAGTETCSDTVTVEIDPRPSRPLVTTDELPALNVLSSYRAALGAEGGAPPYTWSATGLPAGLSLDPSTGVITNDAEAPAIRDAAPVTVRVTVTDAHGATARADLALDVGGVEQIVAGDRHTCAINAGMAYCWGHNVSGQLGMGTADGDPHELPSPVVDPADTSRPLTGVVGLAAGNEHTCALTEDHTVKCWGFNGAGRLGTGDEADSVVPRPVVETAAGGAPLTGVADITAGGTHTCALMQDTTLRCWGYNYWGQLGTGEIWPSNVPAVVVDPTEQSAPLREVEQVTAGSFHTCARVAAGGAYCWGWNVAGQLGNGRTSHGPTTVPAMVADPADAGEAFTGIIDISAGNVHTCAVADASQAYCWGQNANGQLGNADAPNNSPLAAPVVDTAGAHLGGVLDVSAGGLNGCAVIDGGTGYCWGDNGNGQLGTGDTDDASQARPIADPADPSAVFSGLNDVMAGQRRTCALVGNGALSCWGANDRGQLGDGTTEPRQLPTPVHPAPPG